MKNIGVGGASKRGKMNLHGALAGDKPVIDEKQCPGRKCEWWQSCEDCCPEDAVKVTEQGLKVDLDACVYCLACANICINMAGKKGIQRADYLPALGRRIADSALAATLTKEPGKTFFLNYLIDISPQCDCYGWTDTPLVNNIGVLASSDPVAVDKACIDLMNEAPGLLNSEAEDFSALAPGTKKLNVIKGKDIEEQIYGGVENGLGSADYSIEKVPLDRSQKSIKRYYPEIRAKKLKGMYAKNHPLKGIDTASFGRPSENVKNPRSPQK
jgi:uncharacterized Fe-S center protein